MKDKTKQIWYLYKNDLKQLKMAPGDSKIIKYLK